MRKKNRRNTKPSKSSSILKIRGLFIAGPLLIAAIFIGSWFFKISQVTAIVDGEVNPELSSSLNFLQNKSLFFTNLDQTALFTETQRNEQGQIFLPQRIEKKLPGELIVYFTQQGPLYRLNWQENLYLVNSKHFLSEDSPEFELMTVVLSANYQDQITDNQIDPQLNLTIQNLIKALKDYEIQPDKIFLDLAESYLIIEDHKYIFEEQAGKQLLAAKIKIIETHLDKLELTTGAVDSIDLRFDLPVIKSSQPLDVIQQSLEGAEEATDGAVVESDSELDDTEQQTSTESEPDSTVQSSEAESPNPESVDAEPSQTSDDQESTEEAYPDTPTFIE